MNFSEQTGSSTDYFSGYSATATDLVNGVYDYALDQTNPPTSDYTASSDIYPDAQSIVTGYGFDPQGITVFDGNAYFSAVNAEGQDQLWILEPGGGQGGSEAGKSSRMAQRTFSVPAKLFIWVKTARL